MTESLMPGRSISPRVAYAGLALLGLAGLAVLYAVDPRNPGSYPICPFLGLTGCYCPGCGTLRALHRLMFGDVSGALGYNPLTVLSLPFVAYSFAAAALRAFDLPAPRPLFLRSRWIWALLAAILLFWALRNLPAGPLTALAP